MIRPRRECDVCQREITGVITDIRMMVKTTAPDESPQEYFGGAETCSPACALKAARMFISREPEGALGNCYVDDGMARKEKKS